MTTPVSLTTRAPRLHLLEGAEAICQHAATLRQLAERLQQPCAMSGLEYVLQEETREGKYPVAVLQLSEAASAQSLSSDTILGVMLAYEYRPFGVATGVVCTQDTSGFRAVLSHAECRAEFVAHACAALLNRGAHLMLASFVNLSGDSHPVSAVLPLTGLQKKVRFTQRHRVAEQLLPLHASFDDFLATVGKRTRANLRYYSRKLARELPCSFVPDAGARMSDAELLLVNEASLNPVEPAAFLRSCHAVLQQEGGYLVGLRSHEGQWLSLIGGWRQADTTTLEWQSNRAGMERYSLTTAMRAFYLEHEIDIGMRSLRIIGGTPHSLQHSFQSAPVTDLLLTHGRRRAFVTRQSARLIFRASKIRKQENFLLRMLSQADLDWTTLPART